MLKKSWNTSKSFGFVPKFLEKIETFCFGKKKVGTHQKVLVLFQNFWNKQKCSTLGSGTHQNVLVSFRSLASISERLCFRFYQCPNPDPDPPSRIRIHFSDGMDPDSDPDLDPLVRGMDPPIRIHSKMSWIRNTSFDFVYIIRAPSNTLMPLQQSPGLYWHSHGLYKHSICLYKSSYGIYMRSHGLYKHSHGL